MNIERALKGLGRLLDAKTLVDVREIGTEAWMVEEELRYIFEFVKTVREVQTTHDSTAEFNAWDEFFEELANGKS